jgi:hypothetical protein
LREQVTHLTLPLATLTEANQQLLWEQQKQKAARGIAAAGAQIVSNAASNPPAAPAPAAAAPSIASSSSTGLAAPSQAARMGSAISGQPPSKRQCTARRGNASRASGLGVAAGAAKAQQQQIQIPLPASGLLHRLLKLFPSVRHLTLEHNSMVTMQELNKQLGLMQVTQGVTGKASKCILKQHGCYLTSLVTQM